MKLYSWTQEAKLSEQAVLSSVQLNEVQILSRAMFLESLVGDHFYENPV